MGRELSFLQGRFRYTEGGDWIASKLAMTRDGTPGCASPTTYVRNDEGV